MKTHSRNERLEKKQCKIHRRMKSHLHDLSSASLAADVENKTEVLFANYKK